MTQVSKHRVLAYVISLALFSAAALAPTYAQPKTPAQWLEWSGQAREQTSFVGSLLYQHGDSVETVRIWHAADPAGGVRERLQSLSGTHREILRDDKAITCVLPSSDSRFIHSRQLRNPLSSRIPTDMSALQPYYRSALGEQDRVAGRLAQQVSLTPADSMRYGYTLWFDVESGVLLRAEVLLPSGQVIERLMMLDLEIREQISEAELTLTQPKAGFTRVTTPLDETAQAPITDSTWTLEAAPAGFRLHMNELQEISGRPQPVRHLMVSDGLASVSVYVEPEAAADQIQGPLQMGAMSAFGRSVAGHQVIAVGEVPAQTVERIANAVTPFHSSDNAGQ